MSTISQKFISQKFISKKITRLIQAFVVTSLVTTTAPANVSALETEKVSQVDYERKKISQSDRNNRENNPENSKQKLIPASQLSDIQPGQPYPLNVSFCDPLQAPLTFALVIAP